MDFNPFEPKTDCPEDDNQPIAAFTLSIRIVVVVVYGITSILALTGNIVVIIVYSNNCCSTKLRGFLINLAIADIINGVLCIPFGYTEDLFGEWIYPRFLCPIVQFMQYVCVFVTAITLVVISIERYLAILHPFSRIYIHISTHCSLILVVIWILGASYSFLGTESVQAVEREWNNYTYYTCDQHVNQDEKFAKTFSSLNFMLTFTMPLIIMTILYTILSKKLMTIIKIRKVSFSENHEVIENSGQLRRNSLTVAKYKIVNMMILVVISFILCMTPIKVKQVISWFYPKIFESLECSNWNLNNWINMSFRWLATLHSVFNPIIYSFMSNNFREDFLAAMKRMKNYLVRCSSLKNRF